MGRTPLSYPVTGALDKNSSKHLYPDTQNFHISQSWFYVYYIRMPFYYVCTNNFKFIDNNICNNVRTDSNLDNVSVSEIIRIPVIIAVVM